MDFSKRLCYHNRYNRKQEKSSIPTLYPSPHTSDDALGILVLVLLPAVSLLVCLFNAWCMGNFKWQTRIPTSRQKMLLLCGLFLFLLLLALAAGILL
ncbi:MAG: hypothetical protein Q4C45_05690 [Oscillospiraceae bacterium]|nr:hypothetical protein [Oscillospiraceae bacterium]